MRSLFVYISLFAYTLAFAQYDAATTSSVFHSINSNPGITGNKNDMVINLSFRNDWLGDDKNPRSFIITAHTPLKKEHWSVGALAFNDHFGQVKQNGILGFVSYRLALGNGNLSFGVKTGLYHYNQKNQAYKTITPDDPAFENMANIYSSSLGMGLYYETKKYYIGVSIPETANRTSTKFISSTENEYWLKKIVAGINHKVNENIIISGHLLVRKLGNIKAQAQFIPMVSYKEKIDLGLILKSTNTYGFIGSYAITSQFRLSYSLDYNTSIIVPKSIGNHEIILGYSFAKIVNTFNPKFF